MQTLRVPTAARSLPGVVQGTQRRNPANPAPARREAPTPELPRRSATDEARKPVGFLSGLSPHGWSKAASGVVLGAAAAPALLANFGTPAMAATVTTGAPIDSVTSNRVINGVEVTLVGENATQEEAFAHYEQIVEAMGGHIQVDRTHVLGLRGLDVYGDVHATRAQREMADTIVVLFKGSDGSVFVSHFAGSTYPGQARSSQSPDVNRDGRRDVGMIREGRFTVVPNGMRASGWSYHVRTLNGNGRLPGVRDLNQDGAHSRSEWITSAARGYTLGEVLFHPGTRAGSVSSIGCLNVEDFNEFVDAVGGPHESFDFTLVNAFAAEPR